MSAGGQINFWVFGLKLQLMRLSTDRVVLQPPLILCRNFPHMHAWRYVSWMNPNLVEFVINLLTVTLF